MADEEEEEDDEAPASEELISQVFKALDIDGNGHLSPTELRPFGDAVGFEGDNEAWMDEWKNCVTEHGWDARAGPNEKQFIKIVLDPDCDFFCGENSLAEFYEELLKAPKPGERSPDSIENDVSEQGLDSIDVDAVLAGGGDQPKKENPGGKNRDEFIARLFKFLDKNADKFVHEKEMLPFARAHHNIPANDMQWAIEFRSFCTSRGMNPDKGLDLKAFKEVLDDEKSEVHCDNARLRKILLEMAPGEVVAVEDNTQVVLDKGTELICKDEEATVYSSVDSNSQTIGEVMPGEEVVMTGPVVEMDGLELAPVRYGDKNGFVELDCFQVRGTTTQKPTRALIETSFSLLDIGKTKKLGEPELFRFAKAMGYTGSDDDFWDEYKPLCMRKGIIPDEGCSLDQFADMILDDRSLIRCHAEQLKEINASLPKSSKATSKRTPQLHNLFEICDVDGNKYLNSAEFLRVARGLGYPGSDEEWSDEFEAVCEDINCDHSKGISFHNFRQLLDDPEGDYRCDDSKLSSILDTLKWELQKSNKQETRQSRYAKYTNADRTAKESTPADKAAMRIQAVHRGNAAREHVDHLRNGGSWDTCVCGHAFQEDDKVCRECGKKRPHKHIVVHCPARGEIIREIFAAVDKDQDRRLDINELWVFAKKLGFIGTSNEWTWTTQQNEWKTEFEELCSDYDFDKRRGVELKGFMRMINDTNGVCYCSDEKLNEMYRDLVATKGFGPMIDHMNALLPSILNDDEKLASLAFRSASLNGVTNSLAEMKVVDNSSITTQTVGDNLKKMQFAQGFADDLTAGKVHDELAKITEDLKAKNQQRQKEKDSDASSTGDESDPENPDGDLTAVCKCGYEFLPGQRFCRRCGKERQSNPRCPACKTVIPHDWDGCPKCGQEFERDEEEEQDLDVCAECGTPYSDREARFCLKCKTPRPICDDQCDCGAFWQREDQATCMECGAPRHSEERVQRRKRQSYVQFEAEKRKKRDKTQEYLQQQDKKRQAEFDRKIKQQSAKKKAEIAKADKLPSGSLLHAIGESDETRAMDVLQHPSFTDHEAHSRDNRSCTALHCAAERGLATVCKSLVMLNGFRDTDARDSDGWTALHRAARNGHAPVVKLLAAHPLLNNSEKARGRDNFTALHCAAIHGFASTVKALLDHPKFLEVNSTDLWGRTALHVAAEYGHVDTCKVLLEHNRFTNVNARTKWGRTAADVATGKAKEEFAKLNEDKKRASMTMSTLTRASIANIDLSSTGLSVFS